MHFDVVATGLQFPEGPVAMADGSVVVVEIMRKTLTRVAPDGIRDEIAALGGGPNGAAVGPDGAIYVCNNGGSFRFREVNGITMPGPTPPEHRGGTIQRVDPASGDVRVLYDACDGRRFEGPNDLVFDRHGGFWFTDYGSATPRGRNYGSLYYALPDGSKVTRWRDMIVSPNGVGLSPDERTLFVADTVLGRLWAMDVTAPGVLGDPPPAAPGRVVRNLQGHQPVDSLAVEAGGKVCVGTLLNGGITVFEPDGSGAEHIAFPDPYCTNIAFGGADMRDAWITASGTGRLLRCRWPRAGLKLAFDR